MNSKIRELAIKAGASEWGDSTIPATMDIEKFAELIIKECDQVIVSRSPGKVGEGGWVNGYNDGMLTAAFLIKKHFGVEL